MRYCSLTREDTSCTRQPKTLSRVALAIESGWRLPRTKPWKLAIPRDRQSTFESTLVPTCQATCNASPHTLVTYGRIAALYRSKTESAYYVGAEREASNDAGA